MLCFSLLVIVLDNSILNVALPHLGRDLDATNSQLQWMVDSYTLVFAGLLLTAGSLGDRFGRKGALQVGLVVFGLGSLLSAFATSPEQLIATRAFMGIGGAFIMPATLSIITNVFPPEERGRAIAYWAATAGLGVALGPLSGGFLLEHFYWGSIFLVNIPIVAIALVAGVFLIPKSKDPSQPRLDPSARCCRSSGWCALVYAHHRGPDDGWTTPTILGVVRARGRRARRVRLVGAARRPPDARLQRLREPPLLGREPRHHADLLRDVRLDVPAHAVPAVRAGLLAARGRASGCCRGPAIMLVVAPLSARLVERFGTKLVVGTGLELRDGRPRCCSARCPPSNISYLGPTCCAAWCSWRSAWAS